MEKAAQEASARLCEYANTASQAADERTLSSVAMSPCGTRVAVASWGGLAKLFSIPDCKEQAVLKGHTSRVLDVAFHPASGCGLSPAGANIATGSQDSTVRLWSLENTEAVATLSGHGDRLARVRFHPSGRLVASTRYSVLSEAWVLITDGILSFDRTWRLWDVDTSACLQVQEGHAQEAYGLAFHHDGSLVATGGKEAIVWVWDLRLGRSIMYLKGHVKQVLALDFSPNGYASLACL